MLAVEGQTNFLSSPTQLKIGSWIHTAIPTETDSFLYDLEGPMPSDTPHASAAQQAAKGPSQTQTNRGGPEAHGPH